MHSSVFLKRPPRKTKGMSPFNDVTKKSKYFAFLTLAMGLGIAIGFYLGGEGSGTKEVNLEWQFGQHTFKMDLEKDLESHETFLNKIFQNSFSKAGVIEWLKNERKIFYFQDLSILKYYRKLHIDDEISLRFVEMSQRRKGPWQYRSDLVKIGILSSQPRGIANVCETNLEYRGKKIKIYNANQTKYIEVLASGRYECPENHLVPDIQIGFEDAKKLFGYTNFEKHETAIALVAD